MPVFSKHVLFFMDKNSKTLFLIYQINLMQYCMCAGNMVGQIIETVFPRIFNKDNAKYNMECRAVDK